MIEIELEKTYLIKYLPNEFVDFPFKEIKDIYIPKDTEHPILRIRKFGDEYEITKKQPIQGLDSSEQYENTIPLTREEFLVLEKIPSTNIHQTK